MLLKKRLKLLNLNLNLNSQKGTIFCSEEFVKSRGRAVCSGSLGSEMETLRPFFLAMASPAINKKSSMHHFTS